MLNVSCTASKSHSRLRDHRQLPFHHQMHLLSQPHLSVCLHSLYHSHCHVACIKSSNIEDIKKLYCTAFSSPKFQGVHNACMCFKRFQPNNLRHSPNPSKYICWLLCENRTTQSLWYRVVELNCFFQSL